MKSSFESLDLGRLKVRPLAERKSLCRLEDILIEPQSQPPACSNMAIAAIDDCAAKIKAARKQGAAVILMYGAHLLRNGAGPILGELMRQKWITHLATNGAGVIHDWEYSYQGWSTESVRDNVARGEFGAWDETGRFIHLALLAGGLRQEGFGQALGRFIMEDGALLPHHEELAQSIQKDPASRLTPARADLLLAMKQTNFEGGPVMANHPWKFASIVGQAFSNRTPFTVHPGIGYDIISVHPMFNGAVIGRAATVDFRRFGASVANLEGGVVLSIGSAIMAPQVFEKSLSCVNNLRLQEKKPAISGHSIFVVDLQEGGQWDWAKGEPPKTSPEYYLRFCKSFSRMGGVMRYCQCDNAAFIHHLHHRLSTP
jgi:hypothetical protein